jgi:hypothetical protein
MLHWNLRDISREAAAAAMRIPINTLDVWLHRYKAPSGKSGGARVFSLQDICMLQTARQLLSPGILAGRALEIVKPLLHDPPDPDAVLFVTKGGAFIGVHDDWPEENFTAVYVGQVAVDINKRLEDASVAL